ncbi:transposase [Heliorestis acidaminivorans]|nr:transposase [Heliorestis acidaminivorans]
MARTARRKSETGIYHVMLRGIDKRDIFQNESDYKKFLEYIEKAKEKVNFTVYAYCLMTNHVHLLLKETEKHEIGDIVKRIAVGYVQYHNIKMGRVGHLFQNRFKSEAVDKDAYFLTVLRYIHQNPLKAGMVKALGDYQWSSYNEFIKDNKKIVETTFALNYFNNIEQFKTFMKEKNDDKCLEYEPQKRYTDEGLKEIISSSIDTSGFEKMDIATRKEILKKIKEATGACEFSIAIEGIFTKTSKHVINGKKKFSLAMRNVPLPPLLWPLQNV